MAMPNETSYWATLAANYSDQVITPFAPEVDFRLGADVGRLLRKWKSDGTLGRRVVVDLGCGCGESLSLVAGKVGFAVGIDFSSAMLDQSQQALSAAGHEVVRIPRRGGLQEVARQLATWRRTRRSRPTTALVNGDFRRLEALAGSTDLVLAVNSLTPKRAKEVEPIFGQVAACLRPAATWIGVFPSLDSFHYLESLFERYGVEPPPPGRIETGGVYVDTDGQRQKFYCREEVADLLKRQCLDVQRIEKIRYPWRMIDESGWGYFPRRPRLWDWYAVARRSR